MTPASAVPSGGPRTTPRGVVFRNTQTGFVIKDSIYSGATARIQRTRDAGKTWTDVWTANDARLGWIGLVGDEVVATATRSDVATLLRSVDDGASWTEHRPATPLQGYDWLELALVFPSPRLAFAVTDVTAFADRTLLRTTDGGASWTKTLPPDVRPSGGIKLFADGRLLIGAWTSQCASELWRTRDHGDTWQAVSGTCGIPAPALGFLDDRTGFAGGGFPSYLAIQGEAHKPFLELSVTRDGGETWAPLFAGDVGGGSVFRSFGFFDDQHAWAIAGACKMGASGPCGGGVLITDDGGRTWRDSGHAAFRGATLGQTLTLVAAFSSVLWRTEDRGASWRSLARPDEVRLFGMASAGTSLVIDSDAGSYRSLDAGRTWTAFEVQLSLRAGSMLLDDGTLVVPGAQQVRFSVDGGATWRSQPLADPTVSRYVFGTRDRAIDLSYGQQCYPGGPKGAARPGGGAVARLSADGGASWRTSGGLPMTVSRFAMRGLTAAATGFGLCDYFPRAAVSIDGGEHWRTMLVPLDWGSLCEPSVGRDGSLWIACANGSATSRGTRLFQSDDAGASWIETLAPDLPTTLTAVDAGEAWAPRDFGSLWHTTDGGTSWQLIAARLG